MHMCIDKVDVVFLSLFTAELLVNCVLQSIHLAIVVNDWASDADGHLDRERYTALLAAYQARRPLTATERELWPMMLRMTALRYWLSRLLVVYVDPPAHDLTPKDPGEYRRLLLTRLAHGAPPLPAPVSPT